MTLETLFKIANFGVLPFWFLLVVAPRWRGTDSLVHSPIIVILLAPVYAFMVFGYPDASESIDYTSLSSMVEAFSAPSVVVAGWVHYLVFDLFIGAWESRDAMRRGVPHLLVIPCLILTLLLGPLGLLAYVVVRFATTRAVRFDEFAGMKGAAQ